MDAAKWSQGFQDHANLMKPMEEMVPNACNRPPPTSEKKPKPPEHINCPRCNSTNTKFCYYNNYSLTQPRYFCKACRRYWTEGGSLRNVPVGGGSRKNKRSTSSTSSINKVPDLNPQLISSHNPNNNTNPQKGQDLNLAFPMHEGSHGNLPHFLQNSSSSLSTSSSFSPAFELMRTNGMGSTGGGHGLSSFAPGSMPDANAIFSSNFSMQDYKPTLSFTINGVQENAGRVFFPFGDHQMKSTNEVDGNKGQGNSSGYWNNGVLGGGGSWQ